jgi:zinc transporter, ZIP family
LSTSQTILLGAIAGFTIFLGLPLGRMRTTSVKLKTFLSGVSAGVLIFLLVEILEHAFVPVEEALEQAHAGDAAWTRFAAMGAVYVLGIGVGLISLHYVMRALKPKPSNQSIGPGAMAVAEVDEAHLQRREALHLGMGIAAAIGLHNFSEGLAIGQSAHAGDTTLAWLLVIGFALHNATEGFGIVGPLAHGNTTPSWRWLGLAGLVGGGPTFFGTIIGTSFASEFLSVGFLALAGGAIIYVVGELIAGGRKLGWETALWGILVGFVAGAATELVLVLAAA